MYIYNNILLKQQNVFEKVVSAEEIESKVTILVQGDWNLKKKSVDMLVEMSEECILIFKQN